jgi:RNA polymerase sigma factor (sigma-70 family)
MVGLRGNMADLNSASRTRPSLLLRIRDVDDAEAWSTFVEIYAPVVYHFFRRRGLQDSDAADVTQEVMTQVTRSVGGFTYRPECGRFRDWLGAVARNKLNDHLRSRRRTARAAGDDAQLKLAEGDTGSDWQEEFNAGVLRVALNNIRPHFEPITWRAFEYVWIEGRPAAEVSASLGVPLGAIYVAKSRVLKRLRQEVLALAEDLPFNHRR